MEWLQVATIVGVNIALIGAFVSVAIWLVNKLDADVKSIGSRMDSMNSRLDGHATRIDQSYKMFCQLQEDTNKKFYDLLKEGKK